MWTIQKIISKGDYNYALVPDHPNATKNGYVLEHRVVVENDLGRLLSSDEIVHHKDGNRKNNTRGNLEVMSLVDHSRFHQRSKGKKTVDLICPWCKDLFSREHRQTFLSKKDYQYTCCSRSCRGKFSRLIQLKGLTVRSRYAIANNVVRVYRLVP